MLAIGGYAGALLFAFIVGYAIGTVIYRAL
jgi:hypothetical protein